MANSDIHRKFITGTAIGADTTAGLTPISMFEGMPGAQLDAPYSSSTITAPVNVTFNGQAYLAGDVLFYSDGFTIWDSAGNQMDGQTNTVNGRTGGVRSAPQAVSFVKVSNAMSATVTTGGWANADAIYWCFFNSMVSGIRVGVINMNGNSGRGTFTNYLNIGQSGGGLTGVLKNTDGGVCGRMVTQCYGEHGKTDEGVMIITKPWSGLTDNDQFNVHRLTEIETTTGAPEMYGGTTITGDPVVTTIGIPTATNDAGQMGTISITENHTQVSTEPGFNEFKIATIYQEAVGTPGAPQDYARLQVYNLDATTGIISNASTSAVPSQIEQLDRGPISWPQQPSDANRYFSMHSCWSHTSNMDAGTVYYGWFDSSSAPAGEMKIAYRTFDAVNTMTVQSPVNYGHVVDGNGQNIWIGQNGASRIIAGIWRDPQLSGRILVATPNQVDRFTLAVGAQYNCWSTNYPEIYGDFTNPGIINLLAVNGANTPATATHSWEGTPVIDTQMRYGAPAFHYCSMAAIVNDPLCVMRCGSVGTYTVDPNGQLWKNDYRVGQLDMDLIHTLSITDIRGVSFNTYTAILYVWDSPTVSTLTYQTFDEDNNTLGVATAIAANATWDKYVAFTNAVNLPANGGQPISPSTQDKCKRHWFLGHKTGAGQEYSLAKIDTTANTAENYPAANQIDLASFDGGSLTGLIPASIAGAGPSDNPVAGTNTYFYMAVGTKICKFNLATTTWTILGGVAPAVINDIYLRYDGTGTNGYSLIGSCGPASSQNAYVIDQVTGVFTLHGPYQTAPGGFAWPLISQGTVYDSAHRLWLESPLKLVDTDPQYHTIEDQCDNNRTWRWAPGSPYNYEIAGCFECKSCPDGYHTDATSCESYQGIGPQFTDCRDCENQLQNNCMAFFPCCGVSGGAGANNAIGPVELPAVSFNSVVFPTGVYEVTPPGGPTSCAIALEPEEVLWISFPDKIVEINAPWDILSQVTNYPLWFTTIGLGAINTVEDIAFDKHGNLLITSTQGVPGELSWSSAWPGYESQIEQISNSFDTPLCLDTDYTADNHIITGDMVGGVATFRKYTNSLSAGLTLVSTVTNGTLSVGHDIAVDYNSGDYWLIGDQTGAGGLDHLMSIDDATGNMTYISDLAVICSYAANEHTYGIETIRDSGTTTAIYVLSAIEAVGPVPTFQLRLRRLNAIGTAQTSVTSLLNPDTNTLHWAISPNGLALNDLCDKWPGNVDPALVGQPDCATCLAQQGTAECCYRLENCVSGAIQYSNTNLDIYVGGVVELADGSCWTVERSMICPTPVSVVVSNPHVDCAACTTPAVTCYKLPNCIDPTDIIYTTDILSPLIPGFLGQVVQLSGENFCREVIVDPSCTLPQVVVTVVNSEPSCADCNFYFHLQECGNPTNNVYLDYATSLAFLPFVGTADAHDITVGGTPEPGCYQVIAILGPTNVVYPTGAIVVTHTDCPTCASYGNTCFEVAHCCGPTFVANQILSATSGLVDPGDLGQVIEAEITVLGIVYNGCWTVGPALVGCTGVLPDIDITLLNTSTIGTPIGTVCAYCPTMPPVCPDPCEVLVTCIPGAGPDITISPADGNIIGTDTVTLLGDPNCRHICPPGNTVHGNNWFYGDRLGIDFTGGVPFPNLSGGSLMNDYNTPGSTDYTTMGGACCSADKAATLGGTAYNPGNLMFYTDGRIVYDSTHTIMLDDLGNPVVLLGGDPLATGGYEGRVWPQQGALYFPKTDGGATNGLYHQWYVVSNTVKDGPMYWSIIDMTLNGGKGRILSASVNTLLNASACEQMCVTNTMTTSPDYYFYYRKKMLNPTDFGKLAIFGKKITNGVWGPEFVAVDLPVNSFLPNGTSDKAMCSGEMLMSPNNTALGISHIWLNPVDNDEFSGACSFSMRMSDGTANGPTFGALNYTDGYNGGANNGTYSSLGCWGWAQMGGSGSTGGWSEHAGSIAFTANSEYLYCTNDMGTASLQSAGRVERMHIIPPLTGAGMPVHATWVTRGQPDASQPTGWNQWLGDPGPSYGDIALMPNGNLAIGMVNQNEPLLYHGKIGNAPGPAGNLTSSFAVITNPEGSVNSIAQQIDGNGGMTIGMVDVYDTMGRVMGTKFPTYLFTTCPCDPVNIQNIVIDQTFPNCLDPYCTSNPGGQDGFKITECVCTGGSSTTNPCDIADPANQPPYMQVAGKTWSPTCQPNPERWEPLATAVANLSGGINQTLTFTYSFIKAGTVQNGYTMKAFESGPGTVNPTGNNPGCTVYTKTYSIDFPQFQIEFAGIFAKVKALLEGRFNTTCGYNADLTVNFVDMGYESAIETTPLFAGGAIASAQVNGTYTSISGNSNIGDFRLCYGPLDINCAGQGERSSVLAQAYNPSSSAVPGNGGAGVKTTLWNSLFWMDCNEDWRKEMAPNPIDPVTGNSFSVQLVGAHELLHAMGLGHDIDWAPFPCNDSDDCCAGDGNCGCPCYQMQNYPACMNLPCGTANPNALMGPWANTGAWSTMFPNDLTGPEGIYEQRAICGIYGNPDPNYACMDGICLGCTYLTYYSDDFANLTAVAPGIMEWDDGTAAGLRCFEVEYMNPLPPPPYINPLVPINPQQGMDCVDCGTQPNQCYEINLCPCDSSMGAPATIITTTDLSGYCTGTIGNGQVIEIAAWPGSCYEINCTPLPCTALAAPITITNSYIDCQVCCDENELCYELCPCNPVVASDTCSGHTIMNAGNCFTTSHYEPWEFASDPLNGLNNVAVGGMGYKYLNSFTPVQPDPCMGTGANAGCHYRQLEVFQMFHMGSITPVGYNNPYNKADDFITDLVADGMPGAVVGTTIINAALETAINVYFASLQRDPIYFNMNIGPCVCITTSTCITVTNDLSGLIGSVVDLQGPVTVPGLDDTTCYYPQLCGPCSTIGAACTPAGAVVIDQVYATCPDCDSGNPLDCYKLIDCADPTTIINNVCADPSMDAAFLAGDIVQINGNIAQCWEIHADVNCSLPCVSVTITNTFPSCQACMGSFMWECVGPCDCDPSAGAGWPTEIQCLANLNPITGLDCCPLDTYDCDQNCNCIPNGTGTGNYPNLAACQTAITNPVTGVLNCCVSDPTYDCIIPSGGVLSCVDPGNGSGFFTGPTALADCNACITANCPDCYVESWNCIVDVTGNSTCQDPGDGTGTWNNSNGGLAACAACNGCPLDPLCTGVDPTYDCDTTIGCYQVLTGLGAYPDLATCDPHCPTNDPNGGQYEGDCINCLTDPDMQILMEKVAEICKDCNPPFGLEANEVVCDDCFGNSNLYVILDMTSTFWTTQATQLTKLTALANFKTNVILPAFNQLKADFPSYGGHLYILPGSYNIPQCTDYNDSGVTPPASTTNYENWLEWAAYPLTGNAGANGALPNPFTGGTLPATKRATFTSTQIQGVGGVPFDCGNHLGAWNPLVESILIYPGMYTTDGFTQVDPWSDPNVAGMSDPYHEFEGGDRDAIVMIFQDECEPGYYDGYWSVTTTNVFTNPQGVCGAPLTNGVPSVDWNDYGLTNAGVLTTQWKANYDTYMDAYRFGIDTAGAVNTGTAMLDEATIKTMLYVGSTRIPSTTPLDIHRNMFYHVYQAIGGTPGTVNLTGHVSCTDYIPVPPVWGLQCYAVTDSSIPNMYMGASGGGDPTHTTGYKGGSLSNYGMRFFIPDYPIDQMDSQTLYDLWKEYLSDCE
tara:strand:+ start:3671 stop:14668 length:10998 start_codon:yes stop_codon:yes gene_type:complete